MAFFFSSGLAPLPTHTNTALPLSMMNTVVKDHIDKDIEFTDTTNTKILMLTWYKMLNLQMWYMLAHMMYKILTIFGF